MGTVEEDLDTLWGEIPTEAPPDSYVDWNRHAAEIDLGMSTHLEAMAKRMVYEDVPSEDAKGKKFIETRWVLTWKWDSVLQKWVVKARFVAKEFKHSEFRDDTFLSLIHI